MRVLYISQWFEPEPILKGASFARGLADRGFDVEVVTGFPNYPTGKVYPGYRLAAHRVEEIQGIPVHRVALYPSHDNSSLKRIANLFSFAASATLFSVLRARKFDVIYAYSPIPTALAAAAIGMLRRRPFVMEVQDLWPDSVVKSGLPGTRWMARVIGVMCRIAYRRAALVIAQSHGIAKTLIERGVAPDKIDVVYNWAHEDPIVEGQNLKAYGFEGRFNFVYAGNLGAVQGLDTLVRAAALAGREVPELRLLLIGAGVEMERLKSLVKELDTPHVAIAPAVPREEIGAILAKADVLTLHLVNDPLFSITVPHKTQSYMAASKPILIGVAGEAAALVTQSGAGIAAEPGDVSALAEAMIHMARMPKSELSAMGARGKAAYSQQFTFAAALDKTASAIRGAVAKSNAA